MAAARYFRSPGGVLEADPAYLKQELHLREAQIEKLQFDYTAKAQEILAVCLEMGWQILTPESEFYPRLLRKIPDFPMVLYADGDPSVLKKAPALSIVGTRSASAGGLDVAYRLGAAAAESGTVTVSGCAVGVDSAGLEGALDHDGAVIGVLGNGFGYNYLPERTLLRRRVRRHGVLLTELNPFEAPTRYTFPKRNRILVGVGAALAVIESDERGGSMVSAEYAEKQGKRIFIPAREICDSPGGRALEARGATPIHTAAEALCRLEPLPKLVEKNFSFCARDLLAAEDDADRYRCPESMPLARYALHYEVSVSEAEWIYSRVTGGTAAAIEGKAAKPRKKADKPPARRETASAAKTAANAAAPDAAAQEATPAKAPREKQALGAGFSEEEQAIYALLSVEEKKHANTVVSESGQPVGKVLATLMKLLVMGYALEHYGNYWTAAPH